MFGGMNPKQMQAMMKKMGISQTQIHARRVIFETAEGNLVIDDPDVMKIMMQGQESYQVTGEAHLEAEEEEAGISEEDITMVMSQTGKDKETVIAVLEKYDGDIAQAIMEFKE